MAFVSEMGTQLVKISVVLGAGGDIKAFPFPGKHETVACWNHQTITCVLERSDVAERGKKCEVKILSSD